MESARIRNDRQKFSRDCAAGYPFSHQKSGDGIFFPVKDRPAFCLSRIQPGFDALSVDAIVVVVHSGAAPQLRRQRRPPHPVHIPQLRALFDSRRWIQALAGQSGFA